MYLPSHFREDRIEVLHQLIREHSLAALVTVGQQGLMASHLPMVIDPEPAPWGTLRGHMARANQQWRESKPEVPALAIFQGPAAYVSPSWYPTKRETGWVVPTYNYVVVHARGQLHFVDDPARLEKHLRILTAHHEAAFSEQWSIDEAPREFIESQMKSIVALELPIARLEGKWKVSQNRPASDRAAVASALRAASNPDHAAVADWIVAKDPDR
jgi:transcriptional regulator